MRRRLRGEQGVVTVELAIIMIVLLYLCVGTADFGLAWRDKLTIENATRAGARTASNLGRDRSADYNLLQGVRAAVADLPTASIVRIVVFRANTSGTPSATCRAGTPSAGEPCNIYTAASLTLPLSAFTGTTTCTGSSPDLRWCPTGRVVDQATADYLGVWLEIRRDHLTDLIPGTTTIHSTAVMRLEPGG